MLAGGARISLVQAKYMAFTGFGLVRIIGSGIHQVLQKGHRLLKHLEAKAVSHVFSPGFSAICHAWLLLGSERENQDSIAFLQKMSITQCFLHSCSSIARKSEPTNCSQRTAEILLEADT